MILSILIPTLFERYELFKGLYNFIEAQIIPGKVEVLSLIDNTEISTGTKRNRLVEMASGSHFVFVDDDDWVSSLYVVRILEVLERNLKIDGVTFNHKFCHPDKMGTVFNWGLRHTTVWRKGIVSDLQFPEIWRVEDNPWIGAARRRVRTQHHIATVLYYYCRDGCREKYFKAEPHVTINTNADNV